MLNNILTFEDNVVILITFSLSVGCEVVLRVKDCVYICMSVRDDFKVA